MDKTKRYCLITNDVETTSILNHKLRDKTADYVLHEGMPRLLELYKKFDVNATFFYTGYIANLKPEVVRLVGQNHEIASHGLSHKTENAFDIIPYSKQIEHLRRSKEILEDICGRRIVSFRAPAARVNKEIARALFETGYQVDSSVSSQRLDMFLSFGSLKKLNWLTTPRKPYFCQPDNIFKKGDSEVLEIPISALIFPYIGTFMRIAPSINRFTRNILYLETLKTGRPFNFLTHPNEYIDEEIEGGKITRRGSNYVSYLLGDVLRHKLKVKNLGKAAIPILERELKFFKEHGFEFITCQQYYNLMKQNKNASK